jgi:hypothetical protein
MSDSAWGDVSAAIAQAPYPVEQLPFDEAHADVVLAHLGITTRSWLGAVVAHSGGLSIDHGWLRVLGAGGGGLPDVAAAADPETGRLIVAYDVLGGQFAWLPREPGAPPTVHYFGPDTLEWQDLERGYAEWLHATIAGSLTRFYETLRWPGWEAEVSALPPDHGLSVYPPPWSEEGQDLSKASRRPTPLLQLAAAHQDMARQLNNGG